MNLYLLAALLLVGKVALAVIAARRVAFWKAEGARVLQPGHVPPLPHWGARFLRCFMGRLFVFLVIGKLRVIGKHNLKYHGRLIGLANHQTERDAILMPYLFGKRNVRYFIAKTQSLGWRAPLVAFFGGIVVEHATRRGPMAALMAAIKCMQAEKNTDFVIFPQGKLVRDNVLKREEFFNGVAVLGAKVQPKSEKPVAYLPVAIHYDRDPAHATWLHRLLNKLGFRNFRRFFGEVIYGAVILVGEPIPVSCLSAEADEATDELFERVSTLSLRAGTEV